ncbi:hypothetical protein [Mycoplasmopsis felis]|uniref:hypothetical protein n=1 Tax=Mycoplasmopsis felis TaxID=33923 RepID=UPI002AFEC894|nr:hypothetical protein [Mycoplasmopsis felis]WQQ04958.1 hypothetical protein RRG55_01340 [Mycoplasmopsis felis]
MSKNILYSDFFIILFQSSLTLCNDPLSTHKDAQSQLYQFILLIVDIIRFKISENLSKFVWFSWVSQLKKKILKFNKLRDVVDKTFSSLKTNIDFKKINAQSSSMFE